MTKKQFRKQINALIKARKALALANVSEFALEHLDLTISELEDAYIAEVNLNNQN